MKQKLNKFRTFIRDNEAVITVVLSILLIPIVLGILYMLFVAPFAFEELGILSYDNFDVYSSSHLVSCFAYMGFLSLLYIVTDYVCDFASAIVSLIRGKKTRIKTEE